MSQKRSASVSYGRDDSRSSECVADVSPSSRLSITEADRHGGSVLVGHSHVSSQSSSTVVERPSLKRRGVTNPGVVLPATATSVASPTTRTTSSSPVHRCASADVSAERLCDVQRRTNEFDLPGRLFGNRFVDATLLSSATDLSAGASTVAMTLPRTLPRLEATSAAVPTMSPAGATSPSVNRVSSLTDPRTLSRAPVTLSDSAFASEVLFMWMGVEQTASMQYIDDEQRYVMRSGVGSPAQCSAFAQFCELGCFARRLVLALRADTATFFTQQSLHSALRRQLTQYHFLLASLRDSRAASLTLGDLMVVYKRVRPKLCAMHDLLCATQLAKGGELVSLLQRLLQQGSRRVHTLMSDIYVETVSPLLHMVMRCVTLGEVSDPYDELFIVADDDIDDASDRFWSSRFALRTEMLPSTITHAVAEDVLLTTKNVAFIRCCCRPAHWSMSEAVANAQATFASLPTIVRGALVYSNTAVLRFLREQYHVNAYFDLVNAFLLVGYGDFFELLIGKLTPILDKLSQSISVSYVRDEVNSALLAIAPFARHLDTNLFGALHCELVKDEATLGWDAFVLTMSVSSPLNNLFDLHSTKVYRRLFRLLFKVKVAEVSLKNAWRQSVVNDRRLTSIMQATRHDVEAWRKVAADAHLLGLQLNHFVINLWSYLLSEVSSVAWSMLRGAIERCQSFDDVRLAHGAYMTFLTKRCLLHTECTSIRLNIENILMIVREFCGSQALLSSLLDRGAGEVQVIEQQYQTLTDDFHREMASLLSALEEQHQQFDFLNFLLLRINFNYYYRETQDDESVEY